MAKSNKYLTSAITTEVNVITERNSCGGLLQYPLSGIPTIPSSTAPTATRL